jgi:type II secretory pathway pseudopilin PulG
MRRSGLFLIELVIVILFFAVSCTICVRIFAAAKLFSDRARRLDTAVAAAQNAAELYKNSGGSLAQTAGLLGAELSGGTATLDAGDGLTLVMADAGTADDNPATYCEIKVIDPEGETVFGITAAALTGAGYSSATVGGS